MRPEALLPEVPETVAVEVLGRVDDAVAVAVRAPRLGDPVAPLEGVAQAVPITVRTEGGERRGRERQEREEGGRGGEPGGRAVSRCRAVILVHGWRIISPSRLDGPSEPGSHDHWCSRPPPSRPRGP
jgi:hypothetical protein